MKIIHSKNKDVQLPMKQFISFKKVIDFYGAYADDENHPYHKSAKEIRAYLLQYSDLIEGFDDFTLIEKYSEQIALVLDGLFPEILSENEIKAASIPFSFTSFNFSKRFETILDNAGKDYEITLRNLEEDKLYINACAMILGFYYGKPMDIKRPFLFDIPNNKTGTMHHYRVAFNADFTEIIKTDSAPEITDEDYKLLLDNFDNIDIWKEKFPPNSYIYKGFGIMNLFDVTTDETISSIRTDLLKTGDDLITNLQNDLREFFNIKDLMMGFSIFDIVHNQICSTKAKKSKSLILSDELSQNCNGFFCNGIITKVFKNKEPIAISDVEKYGQHTDGNPFYQRLKEKGIHSIILLPIKATANDDLAVLEIASPRPFELNSVNQQRLKDIIPAFEAAVERSSEEHQNTLEATIQQHYTSIHPTVKWRFYEAAEKYFAALESNEDNPKIDEIVFDDVYPLFGQSDIKGSSLARNHAIQEDLTTQLTLAIDVLRKACDTEQLPIYKELMFRVEEYLVEVKKGLKAGDEIGILDFLKKDIYPVFRHIKEINNELKSLVEVYKNRLDKDLNVVYEKRKAYEDSVMILNDKLSNFLDKKQDEAQQMFPHYFERYKTDGVEYNMYIGQSLVKHKTFDELYLYNLRLWQLQNMYEMEQVAHQAKNDMDHKLDVASLILVHSNAMAIKFRMDEKQFDVDGAYNIRYEIIKKRIDKAHIKGTKDRLTVPGKIAIVYSQDKDAREYKKYIKYLQSKGCFGKLEELELEDLQGVSGLKALRVEVIYQEHFCDKSSVTIDELMEEFK
ncbi:GAF domain-containing protein [Ichthyenterobacterium sp. W332]|uniref:GAF domain-containing protein n=1 Tax=Microcosmobacter mediterraneus TaxID=3075607 RepID=A0ABU2YL80_9FLAO|nr:GAF domain-containing protein [Ichthyenterobacterium sp. W332]MDT0558923.1 GAF domain-containing protein [Ichthyenterobacterium sp. W332]